MKGRVGLRIAVALVAVALAGPSSLEGQADDETIRGRVIDDANGAPVTDVRITLLREGQPLSSVVSGEDGSFFISIPYAGNYQLQAQRLGYETTLSQNVLVRQGETLTVEFRILPDAILLEPLLVTARSNNGRDLFERRRQDWGRGIFLTPAMVDSIAPRHPADVFRKQEDIWITWGMGGTSNGYRLIPRIRTFRGSGCMEYMVNKLPARPSTVPVVRLGGWNEFPMDGLLGEDVVAVEIYRSVGEAPPELRRHATRDDYRTCGLTVFWTRAAW